MIVSDYSKIEEQERSWHRRHAVWRARESGATFTDIADFLGLSKTQVLLMYRKAAHESLRDKRSPLASELSQVEIVKESQWCAGLGTRTQAYRDAIVERTKATKPWLAAGMSKSAWWRLWQRGLLPVHRLP